jgi:peptidoglycan/LPS O-acetylase OafA/YrhL
VGARVVTDGVATGGPDAAEEPLGAVRTAGPSAAGDVAGAPGGGIPRLGHVPALDGLRAVALLGVLTFHQRFAWAPGGFLGVSTFFTLSGFLIARLALAEWGRTGGLSLGAFWERRARRLLPATVVTVAAVAVLAAATGIGGQAVHGDLLAALGYVANWRFVATSGDYAHLFTDPSPVAHMWSLAIEEQFYLLFPAVFVLVMRGGRSRRLARGALVWGVLAAASFAAAARASAGGNSGIAYYATFTRAGEVLVGVVAAYAMVARPGRSVLASPAGRGVAAVASPLALGGLAWLWHVTSLGAPGLFRGATALNAALTATVVVAVAVPGNPLARLLGARPLRLVGVVSYGAYLLHWPAFLVLDARRTGIDAAPRLFAVRLAVTLALATASYVLVEAPVRFRLRVGRARLGAALASALVAAAVLAVAVPVRPIAGQDVGVAGRAEGWRLGPTGAGVPHVLLVGDSVAWSVGPSFTAWNEAHPGDQLAVEGYTPFGCPLGGHDVPLHMFGGPWEPWAECLAWHADLADVVARSDADVVVFTSGVFELGTRRIDGRWVHIGQRTYDRWLRGRLDALADLLASLDVPVLWTTFPHVRLHDADDPTRPAEEVDSNDPARVDRLNELVREVAAGRPGFRVVDLEGWTEALPGGEFDESLRGDGVHYSWGAAEPLGAWLAPQVLAAVDGR